MTPLNSRDLTIALKIDIMTGIVPNVVGSPGIGKSALIRGIAKEANLKPMVNHAAMMEPTDINGFPDTGGEYARFKSFENFPTADMKVPDGFDGWLLFMDEMNSASTETQAALYSVILDHKVGLKPLHENCYVVAAGNKKTDRAIVNTMSSAMVSRMVNYEMMFDPSIFIEDVVIKYGWDYRVQAYLEWKPNMAHVFDPEKAEDPYACPRTWDMLQQRIALQDSAQIPWEYTDHKGKVSSGVGYSNKMIHNRAAAEGLIGQDIGREFMAFMDSFGQIPDTDTIIRNPLGTPIPQNPMHVFALIGQLRNDVDGNTLQSIWSYIERFPADRPELKVAFLRGLVGDPNKNIPRSHPVIMDAQRNLRRK
jgi:hypothetical protein